MALIAQDKLLHGLACFGITLAVHTLLAAWLPVRGAAVIAAVLALAAGCAKEWHDSKGESDWDNADLLADAVGVVAALSVVILSTML